MLERRTTRSYEEAGAAFGGVRIRSWEYLEDPATGTALGAGTCVDDTRCQDRGYDILRWNGLVLGIDWEFGDDGVLTLSNPGRSYLAHRMAGAPFVELTEAESRAALRAACEATLVRGRSRRLRVADPDDPGRTLSIDDVNTVALPPPAAPTPRPARLFRRRGSTVRPPHPSAPAPFHAVPEPPRTHETARSLTLMDLGRREDFDYRATGTSVDDWTIEQTAHPRSPYPYVVCRAPSDRPAAGVLTSRLVTRSRPTIPAPSRGPLLTHWGRSYEFSWAGMAVWLTPLPETERPTFEVTGLQRLEPAPEHLTAIRTACEALSAYGVTPAVPAVD